MAKVNAPLGSFSASGKIGNAHVHFSHLGRNVVRALVTPSNPQSSSQGNFRQITGGLGRASKAPVTPSNYVDDVKQQVAAGQTWVSAFIQAMIQNDMSTVSAYETFATDFNSHTASADFESEASALGLADFSLAYSGTSETFTAGMQLYALAQYAFYVSAQNPSLFDRSPYDTALSSWTLTEIQSFVTDIQTVS